jgi:hypothetical protein
MTALDIAAFAFGALGIGLAAWFYVHLYRWAKQCQRARIVIAHKQKVQMNAPLTEVLSWANMLERDEASRGRIVYRHAHASVAIVRREPAGKGRAALTRTLGALKRFRQSRRGAVAA